MTIDIKTIRNQFPSLNKPAIFLDNPGGTQICKQSLDRMTDYLKHNNANIGGHFTTSQTTASIIAETRKAYADFINAARPDEIIFGPNMTSLTLNLSRSLARWLKPGDEIVVTHLDHDANIAPWLLIAQDTGCAIRWVDFNTEDCTLNLNSLQLALENHPKIVAVGYASNAVGTINPIKKIVKMAHEAGALVYVDAVQYAPHGPIDVQQLECDFLVSSAYKYFGPHLGILYGRFDLLEKLTAYKVRPAHDEPPNKFETGTANFEGIAALLGALEYLEWIGKTFGDEQTEKFQGDYSGRKLIFKQAMNAIRAYEFEISRAFVEILSGIPDLNLFGVADVFRLEERVPTFSFTLKGWSPKEIAQSLSQAGIFVWDGNFYALEVTKALNLEDKGGLLRAGAVHYNTVEEIHRFGKVISELKKDRSERFVN